jgi:hypothetical protein
MMAFRNEVMPRASRTRFSAIRHPLLPPTIDTDAKHKDTGDTRSKKKAGISDTR